MRQAKCPICSNVLKTPKDNFAKNIVRKPWGYEYLAYENEYISLWVLFIKLDHQTSMHCHPKKTTGLILLKGEAEVSFLNNTSSLKQGQKVMLRRGLFHSTKATTEKGAFLFEIESPKDKQDLIRLEDKYGRVSLPYEDSSHEIPKQDCAWFDDPEEGEENLYNFANCKISIKHYFTPDDIKSLKNETIVVCLKGGLKAPNGMVSQPGDVVTGSVIKKLNETFYLAKKTLLMTIKTHK